uniref:DDE Tnp4 domain-containing protein n=1 Tax=Fagus sylvatica TaxID=28930 RepID=A0A2N9J877_FAGSY
MAAGGSGGGGARKTTTKQKTKKSQQKHLNQQHLLTLISTATSATHSFLSHHDLLLLPSQSLTLESLLSSSSLSLSSLLSLLKPSKPLSLPPPSCPPPPQQQCWFHRFLSATSSTDYDPRWSHFFHISKPTFSHLLSLLSTSLPSIPPSYALAATLYRMAHGAPYKAVARRFGIVSSEACRAFYTVCKAVNEKLGDLFVFRADIDRIVVGFGALVDSEARFLDVFAGWPSMMKPETILHQTKLYLGVEESRELLNGPMYDLTDGNSVPQYILGESCFPLLPWLLTPYIRANEEDSFGSSEREFNSVHGRAMGLVGTAFGRLGARWQLLSKRWKEESIEFMPFVIVTGCLLHNFLIKYNEPMPDENVRCLREVELPVFEGEVDETAQRIRDALASHLSRVSLRR